MKYQIITLCGSLRYCESLFYDVQIYLERRGHVCLSVCKGEQSTPPTDIEKSVIDKVHFKKIDLSDCIIVLDLNGYIGESTANELQWAELTNKPVYYLRDLGYFNNGHLEGF